MEQDKKRPQQALMNSIEDVKNSIVSEVMSTLKTEASSSATRLISLFESRVSPIERGQDSMKKGIRKN